MRICPGAAERTNKSVFNGLVIPSYLEGAELLVGFVDSSGFFFVFTVIGSINIYNEVLRGDGPYFSRQGQNARRLKLVHRAARYARGQLLLVDSRVQLKSLL